MNGRTRVSIEEFNAMVEEYVAAVMAMNALEPFAVLIETPADWKKVPCFDGSPKQREQRRRLRVARVHAMELKAKLETVYRD